MVGIVAVKPLVYIKEIRLFRPQQSSKCLALNESFILSRLWWMDGSIKLIGFRAPLVDDLIHIAERGLKQLGREAQTENN